MRRRPNTSRHYRTLRAHGIGLELRMAATSEEITPAIDAAKASAVAGVNVLSSPLLFANRRIIFERAAAVGLPAMYQSPEDMARDRAGRFADRAAGDIRAGPEPKDRESTRADDPASDPRPGQRRHRMIDRRKLIAISAGAVLAWPLELHGQQPGRTYRLGGLYNNPRQAPQVALFEELRRRGFAEGQNLTIDPRGYGLPAGQFAEVAVELVDARVDVILAGGNPAIRAAQRATATIPILGFTDDMVGSRLVSSMAHPGGNTTGISILATELDGKRQELLIELLPGARHIAALADFNTTASRQLQALQDTARARGVELSIHQIAKLEEISSAIDAAKAADASGLNVLASPLLFAQRQLIIERTVALRFPAMYQWPETAEEGGLVGYGPRIVQLFRDVVSRQLIKLLQGTKPADIPVEQPTQFELVINLSTAKALGLTIPEAMLDRAD